MDKDTGSVSFSRVVDRDVIGDDNFFEVTFSAREGGQCVELLEAGCVNDQAKVSVRIQVSFQLANEVSDLCFEWPIRSRKSQIQLTAEQVFCGMVSISNLSALLKLNR